MAKEKVERKVINNHMTPAEQVDAMLYNKAYCDKAQPAKAAKIIAYMLIFSMATGVVMAFAGLFEVLIAVPIYIPIALILLKPSKKRVKEFEAVQQIYRDALERHEYVFETSNFESKRVNVIETDDTTDETFYLTTDDGREAKVSRNTYATLSSADKVHTVYADLWKITPFRFLEDDIRPGEFSCLEVGATYRELKLPVEGSKVSARIRAQYGMNTNNLDVQETMERANASEFRPAADGSSAVAENSQEKTRERIKGDVSFSDGYVKDELEKVAAGRMKEFRSSVLGSMIPLAIGIIGGMFIPDIAVIAALGGLSVVAAIFRSRKIRRAYHKFKSNKAYVSEDLEVIDKDNYNNAYRVRLSGPRVGCYAIVPEDVYNKVELGDRAVYFAIEDFLAFSVAYLVDEEGLGLQVKVQL